MPRVNTFDSQSGTFVLDSLFTTETAKTEQDRLFYLVTMEIPAFTDGGTHYDASSVTLVDSNYDVTFNGVSYTRFPLKFTPADMTSDGTISKTTLAVANVTRDIMYYIELCNGLRNQIVKIKTIYANALDNLYTPQPDGSVTITPNPSSNYNAFIEDSFVIDTYAANEQIITFQLDPIIDLEIQLPRRRFMVDSCYWRYGDPLTCKYNLDAAGALATCKKNYADCKLHNNVANFGGFPGINGARRVYL